jgi:hypothetical protein
MKYRGTFQNVANIKSNQICFQGNVSFHKFLNYVSSKYLLLGVHKYPIRKNFRVRYGKYFVEIPVYDG